MVGFFSFYRKLFPVTRKVLTGIADQFHNWLKGRSEKWGAPILDAPSGRRDEFIEPYFRHAKPDQVVAIVKAREPARIMIAIGTAQQNRWHLQIAQRWVVQCNFYVNDSRWGRMFVRICPYLPFSARVCLNQHHWLANRLREEDIDFGKNSNAFLRCSNFQRLQELADSLTKCDLLTCGQKWLTAFTPFFSHKNGSKPDASTGCSSLRSNTATISSSTAGRHWTLLESGCWMGIGPLADPTRSR